MANKLTQKDYFNMIIELAKENGRDDLVAFAEGRIEKLAKKSTSTKPTKNQVANESIKETLVSILTELDNPSTVSEIMTDPRIEVGTSNQKITSLLTQLVKEQRVTNTKEKGKSYYAIA